MTRQDFCKQLGISPHELVELEALPALELVDTGLDPFWDRLENMVIARQALLMAARREIDERRDKERKERAIRHAKIDGLAKQRKNQAQRRTGVQKW